jgi:LigD-like primase-polymerase
MNTSSETWQLGNQAIQVSHLEKVYWPLTGFTKGELLDYYRQIAPVLLPYLKDRPVTLRMYPQGVEGTSYYLRDCPADAPEWLRQVPYQPKTVSHPVPLPLIDTAAGLLWFANREPSNSICGVRALRNSRSQTWPSSIWMLARPPRSMPYAKRHCASTMHWNKQESGGIPRPAGEEGCTSLCRSLPATPSNTSAAGPKRWDNNSRRSTPT